VAEKQLLIISYESADEGVRMAPQGRSGRQKVHEVSPKVFQDSMADTADIIEGSFKEIEKRNIPGLSLDGLEVSLEVTAEGKVGFFVADARLKGTATLKLTFKRPKDSASTS